MYDMSYRKTIDYKVWRQFVDSNYREDNYLNLEIHLFDAWNRCKRRITYDHWIVPHKAKGATYESIKKRSGQLINISSPIMEDLYEYLENEDCVLLLCDETACTLNLIGSTSLREKFEKLGFEKGTYWRDGIIGNNAINSSLQLAHVMSTEGFEHYSLSLHEYSIYSAPIFSSEGKTIGCIAIILNERCSSSIFLSLMHSAAFSIASQISSEDVLFESNKYLSELNILLEGVEEGVLAWHNSGKIHYINNKANVLLGLSASDIGKNISTILTLSARLKSAIKYEKNLDFFETSIESKGKLVSLISSLKLFKNNNGEVERYILLMYPIRQIRNIVNQHSGNKARLNFDDLIFNSNEMLFVIKKSIRAAKGRGSILLRGEDGLDKNHIAQAIHNKSDRSGGPFISIDCQAIPKQAISSEFLGDIINDENSSPSKFELAHGGTIFLENIEHINTEVQAALLHLLKTGLLNLLNRKIVPIDVRVIATSNIDLGHAVEEKIFRKQLLIELQTFDISIPPLRERLDDIESIVMRKLSYIESEKRRKFTVNKYVLDALKLYSWPGNHRELRNVIERAANFTENGEIGISDLPKNIIISKISNQGSAEISESNNLSEIQRKAIIRSAISNKGKVKEMCSDLNIGRTTLWRKIKYYNIDLSKYK